MISKSKTALLRYFRKKHPDWSIAQLAKESGLAESSTRSALSRLNLSLTKPPKVKIKKKEEYKKPKLTSQKPKPAKSSSANRIFGRCGPSNSGYTKLM